MIALVLKSPSPEHPRTPWRCDLFGWPARIVAGRGRTLKVRIASFRAADPAEAQRVADEAFGRLARLIARRVRGVPSADRTRRRPTRVPPPRPAEVAVVPAAVTQLTATFTAEGV